MIPISYNWRSLIVRRTSTLAALLGIALVVFVLASALMLAAGVRHTMGKSGRDDTAIVLRKGSDAEISSIIEEPSLKLISAAPGIKKDKQGQPLVVGETVVVTTMAKKGEENSVSNVALRGVPDNVMNLRDEVRLVAGRMPQAGTNEVLVGQRILGRFQNIELGQSFEVRKNKPATIVGVMEDDGSSFESEIWTSHELMRMAFGREGMVSSVRVRLESVAAFDAFAAYVEQDKRLGLMAMRESAFYEKSSEGTSLFISVMGKIIAFFFSLGAMIGAMITMYASISDRQREIGTLRAIGFSRSSILFSFITESLLLSLAGGLLGILAALPMGLVRISMPNIASFSEVVFSLRPTTQIMLTSIISAAGMGLLGGFLPALRAARISAIEAMR